MAPVRPHHEARSLRAFRALLALYPAAFRDEYHRELTLVFVDQYRDAAGPWDRARLWLGALAGVLAEAPKEHARMILQDLRYALRVLRQQPLVTTTIVITLGLGLGANAAIFTLLNAVVLRTLPVPHADQLLVVRGGTGDRLSGPMFERFRQAAPDGVDVAAMSRVARVYTRTAEARETAPAALQLVSAGYFRVLAVSPALGRSLPGQDDMSRLLTANITDMGHSRCTRP